MTVSNIISIENSDVCLINFSQIPDNIQKETRNWRNSSEVQQYFKIPYIDEQTHEKWLNSLKKVNPKTIAFMIRKGKDNLGVTYFHSIDYDSHVADWGMYIYPPEYRGQGIGKLVLNECILFAKNELLFNTLFLDVKKTNERAIKLYEKLGFKQTGAEGAFLRYRRDLSDV